MRNGGYGHPHGDILEEHDEEPSEHGDILQSDGELLAWLDEGLHPHGDILEGHEVLVGFLTPPGSITYLSREDS